MSLIVQKFGGTSVADVDRIRHVAGIVGATRAAGRDVVVVVSAMAGETNRLLALALQDAGLPARSFLGHQVRIETDSAYGRARIVRVDVDRLRGTLAEGTVAVVA